MPTAVVANFFRIAAALMALMLSGGKSSLAEGAFAVGENSNARAFGLSANESTPHAAVRQARALCRKYPNGAALNCKFRSLFSRECAALATSSGDGYALMFDANLSIAEYKAIVECQNETGSLCSVRRSLCDTKLNQENRKSTNTISIKVCDREAADNVKFAM
jgi:hypothetical protein